MRWRCIDLILIVQLVNCNKNGSIEKNKQCAQNGFYENCGVTCEKRFFVRNVSFKPNGRKKLNITYNLHRMTNVSISGVVPRKETRERYKDRNVLNPLCFGFFFYFIFWV